MDQARVAVNRLRDRFGRTVTPSPRSRTGLGGFRRLRGLTSGMRDWYRLRRQRRGVSEQDEGHGLGDLLGKGVVEDQRVVSALISGHVVGTFDDLFSLAFAEPADLLQAETSQSVEDGGGGIRSRACGGRQVFGRIGAVRASVGAQDSGMAGVLEYSEIEGFLVRLNAPGDGVAGFDIHPTNKVGLDTSEDQKIGS
ncbi:uncharacterized protein LDX57_006629 [Aspergillus melleus]|uniref:uncharacterized protein n=1 Tax=Aspergillus melleus TaxID=138277 RepID=UPI001E8D99E7|nr:uncharacterized protein LDX57_006629 [Aspergillus melleus]KAH8428956.1 hypothetical protein LDX57_006629 [Aspergillus melleus]